jgi:hypothetical protein
MVTGERRRASDTQESVEVQFAQIDGRLETMQAMLDGRLSNIEARLLVWTQCRHITKEGECDFFSTVVEHDRALSRWAPDLKKINEHEKQINQWTGAMSLASAVSAFVGALLAIIATKVWK